MLNFTSFYGALRRDYPEHAQGKALAALCAIASLLRKNGYLEADVARENWDVKTRGDTIVVYYPIEDCGDIEKYDTRDELARRCHCRCDLDYMDIPGQDNILCAAFYDWQGVLYGC